MCTCKGEMAQMKGETPGAPLPRRQHPTGWEEQAARYCERTCPQPCLDSGVVSGYLALCPTPPAWKLVFLGNGSPSRTTWSHSFYLE